MAATHSPVDNRLVSIDVLRGCAALGVLLSHSFPHELTYLASQAPWFGYLGAVLSRGTLGVPLFFVISGFCIHLRWADRYGRTGQVKLDYVAFWKRRIYRLYPPYFIVLCFCMLMVVVAYLFGRANYYPEPRLQWIGIDFVAHVFMLHGFHPWLDFGGNNPPMWTLAREEYFYVMYFGLLAWRRTWGLISTTVGVLVLGLTFPVVMRLFVPDGSPYWNTIYTSALVLWIQWVLGMVAVESYYGVIKLPRWCRAAWMVPVWFIAGEISRIYIPVLSVIFWGMTFFTLLNFCVDSEKIHHWASHKITVWLANVGLFSYSIYLIHYPVHMLIRETSSVIARPPNVWIALIVMALKIVVGFYVAKLFFNLVERRFLNKPVRFRSVKTDSPGGGVSKHSEPLAQPNNSFNPTPQ
ncbi:MAG TPA: acyltransferase [Pyrinomonadaceae bacterium]|jgi:peptidoglycan/LPS O-acetylase OafA/YrhL